MAGARRVTPLQRPRRRTPRSFSLTPLAVAFVGIVLIGGVLSSIYYGTRVAAFRVSTVLVQGGTTISPMAVRSIVEEVLDNSYFGLVPNRFVYHVPHEEIERRLREIPRLSRVRITQPYRTVLSVEFEEYQPSALWCDDSTTCMFIDATGFAFAEAPASLTGSLYPRVVVASSSPSYAVHLPADVMLGDMLTLRTAFAQYGLSLLETRYIDEYDVWYVFTGGSVVKIRRKETADGIVKRLEQLFTTDEYASLPKVGFKSIDLRFGNRVYVRDKNASDEFDDETSEENSASTATAVTAVVEPEVAKVATSTTSGNATTRPKPLD